MLCVLPCVAPPGEVAEDSPLEPVPASQLIGGPVFAPVAALSLNAAASLALSSAAHGAAAN